MTNARKLYIRTYCFQTADNALSFVITIPTLIIYIFTLKKKQLEIVKRTLFVCDVTLYIYVRVINCHGKGCKMIIHIQLQIVISLYIAVMFVCFRCVCVCVRGSFAIEAQTSLPWGCLSARISPLWGCFTSLSLSLSVKIRSSVTLVYVCIYVLFKPITRVTTSCDNSIENTLIQNLSFVFFAYNNYKKISVYQRRKIQLIVAF